MGNPMIEIYLNNTRVQAHEFDKDSLTIGRSHQNDIALDDLAISRVHAKLTKSGDDILLEDQSSENGCFLNGLRIRRAILQPEDEILIARYRLKFTPVATQVESITATEAPASDIRQELGTIFVPPQITAPGASAVLVLRTSQGGEKTFAWDKPEILIGRGGNCEISLFEAQVARRHARLVREGDRYVIEDLGSANGTQVNGKRITTHGLAPGDIIRIGTHEIVFQFDTVRDNAAAAKPEEIAATQEVSTQETKAEPEIQFAFESKPEPEPESEDKSEGAAAPSLESTLPAADQTVLPMSPPPLPKSAADVDTAMMTTLAGHEDLAAYASSAPNPAEASTIPEDLRVTPVDAVLRAAIEAPKAVSSLFDTDVTLNDVTPALPFKPPALPQATTLVPPPLPKQRQAEQAAPATGITQPLHPELVETQIKLRPQGTPTQEITLEICIDPSVLESKARDALQQLCENGLELPARLRLRTK